MSEHCIHNVLHVNIKTIKYTTNHLSISSQPELRDGYFARKSRITKQYKLVILLFNEFAYKHFIPITGIVYKGQKFYFYLQVQLYKHRWVCVFLSVPEFVPEF